MSDILSENRKMSPEEMMVMMVQLTQNIEQLVEDGKRRDQEIERLTEDAKREASFRKGPEVDRLSEKLYQMDRRIDRLSDSVYAMDQRIRSLSDMVYKISQNMGRSDEKPDRSSQKVEPLDRYDEKSRAERKKWNIRSAEISIKHGTTAYDLLAPCLADVLRDIVPCPPDEEPWVNIRGWCHHPKQRQKTFSIDGIVECGQYALFCDWTSELISEDITELVAKLAQAREYFPAYADYHLLGAVGTLHIKPTLVQYASDKGILAFAVGEELMEMQNEAGFKPKRF